MMKGGRECERVREKRKEELFRRNYLPVLPPCCDLIAEVANMNVGHIFAH